MWSEDEQEYPNACVINTTSKATVAWQKTLSPFYLGPCPLYGDLVSHTMENAWQYSKVYEDHVDDKGEVTDEYWKWAMAGWKRKRAVRYPMGKGATPLYSLWNHRQLDYVQARKVIYVPLYSKAVAESEGWKKLQELYKTEKVIVLKDFDAYNHDKLNLTLLGVLNDPEKKMGHAFVLKMMLEDRL